MYKRNGLYEKSITIKGKRVRFYGKTVAEVNRQIAEYREDEQKGRKFEVVSEEWYDTHSKTIRTATQLAYRGTLNALNEEFGRRDIKRITPLDLARYVHELATVKATKSTVNLYCVVLKQVFAYAVLSGDVDISPAAELRVPRGLSAKKRRALTREEERKVEQYRGEHWLLGLALLCTGCRKGELLALSWRDIDRAAGVIHITKKLNWAGRNTPVLEHFLKSDNGERDVPLLEPFKSALPRNQIGLLFPGQNGYLTKSEIYKTWREYCGGIGFDGITMHQFRHSFATVCYEAGITEKAAARFMGDTEEVVRRVYAELRAGKIETEADKLNAFMRNRAVSV